jgi:hypothetical protein
MKGILYSAAGTHPGVLYAIPSGSVLAYVGHQPIVCDFLVLGPGMRYDGILRGVVIVEGNELKVAAGRAL